MSLLRPSLALLAVLSLLSTAEAQSAPPDAYADVPHEEADWCTLTRLRPENLFDQPVGLVHLPDGSTIIAGQRGPFHRVFLDDPDKSPTMFLDFTQRMHELVNFEEGVHGIALHPDFATNRRFFLSYSQNAPRRTVISEMLATGGKTPTARPETERILMEVAQPLADHWGGQLVFGPDNFLYIGLGDGGLRDDPYRMAQNPWLLHGKILRINVDGKEGAREYSIPDSNPFVGKQLMREEIWASGIRNPWGLAFDPKTNDLWCADVGQDAWEEINRIVKGGNYGWSDRDGPAPFHLQRTQLLGDAEFIDPVFAYTRMRGDGICIVGGILYRGKALPKLQGSYIYGEWGYGLIQAVKINADQTGAAQRWTLYKKPAEDKAPFNPVFIGTDPQGEPLVLSQNGSVWRLTPQ